MFYRQVDISNPDDYVALNNFTAEHEEQLKTAAGAPRVMYLATAQSLLDDAVRGLHFAGMIPTDRKNSDRMRVVVEKPFGHDLASAEILN